MVFIYTPVCCVALAGGLHVMSLLILPAISLPLFLHLLNFFPHHPLSSALKNMA